MVRRGDRHGGEGHGEGVGGRARLGSEVVVDVAQTAPARGHADAEHRRAGHGELIHRRREPGSTHRGQDGSGAEAELAAGPGPQRGRKVRSVLADDEHGAVGAAPLRSARGRVPVGIDVGRDGLVADEASGLRAVGEPRDDGELAHGAQAHVDARDLWGEPDLAVERVVSEAGGDGHRGRARCVRLARFDGGGRDHRRCQGRQPPSACCGSRHLSASWADTTAFLRTRRSP